MVIETYHVPPFRNPCSCNNAIADYKQRLSPVTSFLEQLFQPEEDLTVVQEIVPGSVWYRSLCYKTQASWSRARRVVTKVAYESQGLKMRKSLLLYLLPKSLQGSSTRTNIVPEGKWRTGLRSSNWNCLMTFLLPIHLRVINSGFGFLPSLTFSCKLSVPHV